MIVKTPELIPVREIDWTFVIGFGLIGTMVLVALVLSLRKGRFHSDGSNVYKGLTPTAFWFLVAIQFLILVIVFGGLGLYIAGGGTIVDLVPADRLNPAGATG